MVMDVLWKALRGSMTRIMICAFWFSLGDLGGCSDLGCKDDVVMWVMAML